MGDLISPVGISLGNDSEDVLVLTPIPATASSSTDSTERVSSTNKNLPKPIRENLMSISKLTRQNGPVNVRCVIRFSMIVKV